jgi:hypothetical protein
MKARGRSLRGSFLINHEDALVLALQKRKGMTRAKIKSIEIMDAPELDPAKYIPDDPSDFGCTFGLKIGPADDKGEELFYLTACTPHWLAKECERDGFVWGRHHLVVPQYNLDAIVKTITEFVEECFGDSWSEVAVKLSRLAACAPHGSGKVFPNELLHSRR